MGPLALVGVGCQAVGLILAAIGMRQTWQAHAPEPFLKPAAERLAMARERAVAIARRILRRPTSRTVKVGFSATGAGTFRARARIGYGRLAKNDAIAALGRLEARTVELLARIGDLDERVADQQEATDERLAELDRRLAAETARLEGLSRDIAVEGVRLEAVGLVVVALGTVLQALG